MTSDVQQRLIQAAQALRKRIYSGLPWGLRVARFLFEIRYGAEPSTFGRLAYGMFLMTGVNGLPSIDFTPQTIKDIDKLPNHFGKEFGFKARNVAARFLRSSDEIEELLSTVALKLITSTSARLALTGQPLYKAEGYVLTTIKHAALEKLRSDKIRRFEDIAELIDAPAKWDDLVTIMSEREKDQIAQELQSAVSPRLYPDLPLLFQLLVEGYSTQEIANNQMLPFLRTHPMSQQGLAKHKGKIREVLHRHFDVGRNASSKIDGWGSIAKSR